MYALNLSKEHRILSACNVLSNGVYDGMQVVSTLPTGETAEMQDVHNWLYVDGQYVFDPLPVSEETEPAKTLESRVETLETSNAELAETVDMILSGVTADD